MLRRSAGIDDFAVRSCAKIVIETVTAEPMVDNYSGRKLDAVDRHNAVLRILEKPCLSDLDLPGEEEEKEGEEQQQQ